MQTTYSSFRVPFYHHDGVVGFPVVATQWRRSESRGRLNDAGEIQIQQRRKLIVRSAFICGVELTPFATNTCCRLPKKKANRENFIVIVFCENNPSKIDLDFYGISLRRRSVTNVTNVTNLTFYLISEI
jgi:hypothetical protein